MPHILASRSWDKPVLRWSRSQELRSRARQKTIRLSRHSRQKGMDERGLNKPHTVTGKRFIVLHRVIVERSCISSTVPSGLSTSVPEDERRSDGGEGAGV